MIARGDNPGRKIQIEGPGAIERAGRLILAFEHRVFDADHRGGSYLAVARLVVAADLLSPPEKLA